MRWAFEMTDKTKHHLRVMNDIYVVSAKLGIKTFIWGGYAVDILHGKLTREHSDLDCFTENLVEHLDALKGEFERLGYSCKYLDDWWMLILEKDSAEAAVFNSVRNVCGIAHWHHAGPQGTIFFPYEWLDQKPHLFYGSSVYTFGAEMAYITKVSPRIMSPNGEWQGREKDEADVAVLEQIISSKGIDKDEIKKKVWAHCPWLYAKGHDECFFPTMLS